MSQALSRRRLLYSLAAGGGLLAAPALARTEWTVRGSEQGRLRLAFYSDVHAHLGRGAPQAVMQAAAAINAQQPDLVFGGGDLIHGGFNATMAEAAPRWDLYMAMHDAIRGEHHAVIGNHDLVAARPDDGSPPIADPKAEYRRRLGRSRTFWSFDALGYHFMLLDSVRVSGDDYQYYGWISRRQREWIHRELSGLPRAKPIVVVLHIPLLTAYYGAVEGGTVTPPPNRVVVNNLPVLELFADHNLVLVLQGHLHVKELLRWRGTTFIMGGAICGRWWTGPNHGTVEGFNTITLDHDRIAWQYLDYGWQARP
ncbi:MAG: metallophosphoesterase [Alphaproteobacteria bacterium]|jgi:3',5'-cyclic AMP phosphodiesterase CpdA|nr:metallophosphoesterase [Alphaproteobacteria bacterium]MDP6566809.1 metallophosphoesterase [Alphaproteobacteria bacterium]MDP6813918.1 metallophosphoesterase [Alphaproteobacteria bacterium]